MRHAHWDNNGGGSEGPRPHPIIARKVFKPTGNPFKHEPDTLISMTTWGILLIKAPKEHPTAEHPLPEGIHRSLIIVTEANDKNNAIYKALDILNETPMTEKGVYLIYAAYQIQAIQDMNPMIYRQ